MRNFKLYALTFATIAMSLVSCVKKEDATPDLESVFHVVHFETESSETKTTMDIDGTTVNFAWEETDYDVKLQRFHVWENENEAVRVVPTHNAGKISLDASFAGELPENPSYVGHFNGKVPALQVPRDNQYDADADVLVAESRKEEDRLLFYFQRVVAIGKLTLKGIEAGETLQSVTFELDDADQFLTASLTKSDDSEDGWAWTNTGKKITLNCNIAVTAGNNPVLYFTSVPVTDGQFTVKAVTDKNTYSKVFSKPISLTRGNVKGMSVTLEKDEKEDTDGSFIIDVATFSISGNTALKVADYTSNSFNAGGYSFNSALLTTNNANSPTSNTPANYWIQIKGKSNEFGLIKNAAEIPLKSITVYSKDANTTYGVTAGVTTTLSSLASDKVQQNSDVQVPATGSYKNTLKSYTYDLTGMKYFQLKASSTTYLYKIEVAYSTVPPAEKLATPANLSVNADKQIVWDRVENAGSYNVYINGGEAIPVTDHYYDASSVEDGYYNVSVEAVPANSEMFVTSDKATLTNAKFGTPTLATPAPEVVKTDKTITLTWAVDAHATNGYTYNLYQGEDVVESPTANYRVAEGVATLVYSNLSPKTAYSVKVNATLVESPLRYEASEVYTTDDITTLSTINYAELQNGTYSDQTTCAAVGDPVYFTATPSAGYKFDSVSVTGIEAGDIERADEIFTFTMPDLAEVTVVVTFAQSGFTLGTSLLNPENDHGTVVIDSPKERYTVTDVIALTVTPEAHYEYASVSAEETGEGTNSIEAILNEETDKYEIRGLHFNAELVAYFNKINYAIAVAEGIANGTVTRGSETATYNQENVSFTVKPNSGYQISTVTVSGTSGNVEVVAGATDAQGTHYTFTMPGEDVTINATFDAIVYDLTDASGDNGSLSFKVNDAAATTATIGQTVTITATPADGYELVAESIKAFNTVSGAALTVTNNKFTMPAANVNVTAEFRTITGGGESTITINMSKLTNPNTTTTVTYGTYNWSSGSVSGVYNGASSSSNTSFQFNYSQSGSSNYRDRQAVYNTVAVPGKIKSIKMVTASGTNRTWTPYVSASAITPSNYTSATALTARTVNSNPGTTWEDIEGNNTYFYLNYTTGSASYIGDIIITYESNGDNPGGDTPGESVNYTKLASSVSSGSLADGTYLIVYSSSTASVAMKDFNNSKKMSAQSVTVAYNKINGSDEVTACEVEIKKISGTNNYSIKLKDGKYLGWDTSTDFAVSSTIASDKYKWTITINSSGGATIKNVGDTSRLLKANSTSDFRPYTSTNGNTPSLFKKN